MAKDYFGLATLTVCGLSRYAYEFMLPLEVLGSKTQGHIFLLVLLTLNPIVMFPL